MRCTLEELPGLIEKDLARLRRACEEAINNTAEDSIPDVKDRAPKAFGDLRGSVHLGDGPKIVVDAPHAAAVERGSAPHKPDLEKLVAWVKLRGMQGLRDFRNPRRHGPTTATHAATVKEMLAREVQSGPGGRFSPVDAPRKVAEAIAKSIELNGTKPTWFVRSSLPDIQKRLVRNLQRAVKG